jgi:Cellulase (glycosyl hydrolase family 5)
VSIFIFPLLLNPVYLNASSILRLPSGILDAQATLDSNRQSDPPHQGVNLLGYYTTLPESRDYHKPIPDNYYEQSFKILSQSGMDTIRYLFTWESYEKNPSLFIEELRKVAQAADKWGINILYANDQFHISSWLDPEYGYGFPYFLFENNNELPYDGGGASDTVTAKLWWTNWYNRTASDANGNDGWTLQANFLKKVAQTVDNYTSTLGYEILNEPQVYDKTQWQKIGNYNTYIANELRKLTSKTIVFDRQLPSDIGGPILALPDNMAKMAPKNTTNSMFKSTLFGLPEQCSYAEDRLSTSARTAQLARVPLWLGEFNIGITPNDPVADINQTEVKLFIDKFKEIRAWGWAYWMWSFRQHPENVRNYDLVNVTGNNISTTEYFDYYNSSISQESGNVSANSAQASQVAPSDTICPTAVVTRINGTSPGTNYSNSTSDDPIPVYVESDNGASIIVEGQVYDTGSGISTAEIHLKDSPYQDVNHNFPRDWSKWSSIIPIGNASGENQIVLRVLDNAGNLKYHTIFIEIVNS